MKIINKIKGANMKSYFNRNAAILFLVISVFGVFFLGCTEDAFKATTTAYLSAENKRKAEAVIDKYMADRKIPAAIFGVWTSEGEMKLVKGKSDVAAGADARLTDRFRIASVTKTFTATLALMLIDQKKLGLEDLLSKFYPGVKNADKITIRKLLNHTSGIKSYTTLNEFDKYVKTEPLKKWSTDELLKMVEGTDPLFEPGEGYEYSNSNYLLLGLIIEKVSGNKYADLLKNNITTPLGMTDTYYAVDPLIEGSHFHGYDGTSDVSLFDPSGPNFAGAIVSTLADLKKWCDAFSEGKLLSKELREESNKYVVQKPYPMSGYGLGMMVWGTFTGHSGLIRGNCTVMFHHHDPELTIIGMYPMCADNLNLATEYTFNEISDIFLPGEYKATIKADKLVP